MSETILDRIDLDYSVKEPTEDQVARINAVTEVCKQTAHTLLTLTPQSREQSISLTKLEEVRLWAVSAIVRDVES